MIKKITVPDIGDFENVEIVEILVKQGDEIKKNDPLITLESDKSSVEVPSTQEGIIEKISVKVGDKVSKGDLILSLNSKNGESKSTIPPVTEKIIEEAEQTLKKENKIEKSNNLEKPRIQKEDNRIIIHDESDIDPLETKDWIESLNAIV